MRTHRRTQRRPRTPYAYQVPAIEYACGTNTPALFMEMRLGKSFVCIEWLKHHRPRRALIVCPLSVVRTWQREFAAAGLRAWSLHGTPAMVDAALDNPSGPSVFIANYDTLRHRSRIRNEPWDAVALDESPAIKNPQAKRTKIIHANLRSAPLRCLMTGMPNPNGLEDYVEQLRWLCGGDWMGAKSWWDWRGRFMRPAGPYDFAPKKGTIEKVDQWLRTNAFTLTRQQAGVGPGKVREIRYVTMPPELRTAYRSAMDDWITGDEETKWAPVLHVWVRRLCGGSIPDYTSPHKVNELRTLLGGELAGQPTVVWCAFRAEMDIIVDALIGDGFAVAQINGDHGVGEREQIRTAFMDGELDHVVCQMDCARYGLNLSRADAAINFSRSMNPESNWQSEDRIVHVEKSCDVLIVDIVTDDTIEEDIRDTLFERRADARSFMSRLRTRIARRL